MITLISVAGRSLLVSQLLPKDKGPIQKIFQDIINNHTQSVSKVANSQFRVLVTPKNTNEKDYETVLHAVSTVLSTTVETRQRRETLAGRAQSWAPVISNIREGLGVTSDLSSGLRNGLTVAKKISDGAAGWLGGIGGVANVGAGVGIMHGAVQQYSAATVAKDTGGRFEAVFLTGLMGLALAVVGVAMFLYFPHIALAVSGPMLNISAFVMYGVIALRALYIGQYLYEFRSGLMDILENEKDEQIKMHKALIYLESFAGSETTAERKNKLIRRVGETCALDIETRLPVLREQVNRVNNGYLKGAQELVQEVLEANRQAIASQLLLFIIAAIALPCYFAAFGASAAAAGYSEAFSSIISFVCNILWLFIDQRHGIQIWSELSKGLFNVPQFKETEVAHRRRTESLIRLPRNTGSELILPNQEFRKKLKKFDVGSDEAKRELMREAVIEVDANLERLHKVIIGDVEYIYDETVDSVGKNIVEYLRLQGLKDRDIYILLAHIEPGIYIDVEALSARSVGYNENPVLSAEHRLSVRMCRPANRAHQAKPEYSIFRIDVKDGKAVLTHTDKVEVISKQDPKFLDQDGLKPNVYATKRVKLTLDASSAELTAMFF